MKDLKEFTRKKRSASASETSRASSSGARPLRAPKAWYTLEAIELKKEERREKQKKAAAKSKLASPAGKVKRSAVTKHEDLSDEERQDVINKPAQRLDTTDLVTSLAIFAEIAQLKVTYPEAQSSGLGTKVAKGKTSPHLAVQERSEKVMGGWRKEVAKSRASQEAK